jgi:hypothetical protein
MTSRSLLGMLSTRLLKIWLVVLHPQTPQPLDLIPQLVQVDGVGLLQLHLQQPPHFLYWAEIRAVARKPESPQMRSVRDGARFKYKLMGVMVYF